MRELSLHLLDIAENSISAKAQKINITVTENTTLDLLKMSIEDNGCGMDAEMLARVVDPFVTTRTTRKVGLGIPLLKAAAEACNGSFEITSTQGSGTFISAQFQRSHIDRMPMGNLEATILHLVVANPFIHWIFEYHFNENEYIFDNEPIKAELGDMLISEPEILGCLREMLHSGIQETQTGVVSENV